MSRSVCARRVRLGIVQRSGVRSQIAIAFFDKINRNKSRADVSDALFELAVLVTMLGYFANATAITNCSHKCNHDCYRNCGRKNNKQLQFPQLLCVANAIAIWAVTSAAIAIWAIVVWAMVTWAIAFFAVAILGNCNCCNCGCHGLTFSFVFAIVWKKEETTTIAVTHAITYAVAIIANACRTGILQRSGVRSQNAVASW